MPFIAQQTLAAAHTVVVVVLVGLVLDLGDKHLKKVDCTPVTFPSDLQVPVGEP